MFRNNAFYYNNPQAPAAENGYESSENDGITLSETGTMATVIRLTNTVTRDLIHWGYNVTPIYPDMNLMDDFAAVFAGVGILRDHRNNRSTAGQSHYVYNWNTGFYECVCNGGEYNIPVTYNEVFSNFIEPNSVNLSGSDASMFLSNIQSGMNYYIVTAFDRETVVTAFGSLGSVFLSDDGAIGFSNPTAGAYAGEGNVLGVARESGRGGISFWDGLLLAWDLKIVGKDFPDLISFDITVNSTAFAGGSITYAINLYTRGERGINITVTEQNRIGGEINWGFNLNVGYYQGNPLNSTHTSVAGPLESISAGWGYSGQGYFGYNTQGEIRWIGGGIGIGFSGGASYGFGETFIIWP